jgi:hypothetical protein
MTSSVKRVGYRRHGGALDPKAVRTALLGQFDLVTSQGVAGLKNPPGQAGLKRVEGLAHGVLSRLEKQMGEMPIH